MINVLKKTCTCTFVCIVYGLEIFLHLWLFYKPGGSGTHNTGGGHPLTPNKKFILEMNEQGKDLPQQTRKFVLYFSEEVTPHVLQSENKIRFSPISGGQYNGIVQLAYIGKLGLQSFLYGGQSMLECLPLALFCFARISA